MSEDVAEPPYIDGVDAFFFVSIGIANNVIRRISREQALVGRPSQNRFYQTRHRAFERRGRLGQAHQAGTTGILAVSSSPGDPYFSVVQQPESTANQVGASELDAGPSTCRRASILGIETTSPTCWPSTSKQSRARLLELSPVLVTATACAILMGVQHTIRVLPEVDEGGASFRRCRRPQGGVWRLGAPRKGRCCLRSSSAGDRGT